MPHSRLPWFFHTADHTFQTENGQAACESSPNDFVADTTVHSGDSSMIDCTQFLTADDEVIVDSLPDTCPDEEGRDPIFNYMCVVQKRLLKNMK